MNVASGFPAFDPFPGLFSALPLRKVPKSRQNRAHFPPLRVSLSGGWGAPPTTLILLRNQRRRARLEVEARHRRFRLQPRDGEGGGGRGGGEAGREGGVLWGGRFGAGAPGPADSLALGVEPKECGLTTQKGGALTGIADVASPLRLWPTLTATRSIVATAPRDGRSRCYAANATVRAALATEYAVDSLVACSGRRLDYVASSHPTRPV